MIGPFTILLEITRFDFHKSMPSMREVIISVAAVVFLFFSFFALQREFPHRLRIIAVIVFLAYLFLNAAVLGSGA